MLNRILIVISLIVFTLPSYAQRVGKDRVVLLQERLDSLSEYVEGLNEQADFTFSGGSVQDFLRGLAETHSLNINIAPEVNFKIYNNFTGEKVGTILLFLCKEYDLDIRFTGTIMSFYRYVPPTEVVRVKAKSIQAEYNTYNDHLTLDLKNDTLSQVAKRIIQLTKKNIVLAPELNDKRVNIYIEDMNFDQAIDKLALANNLKINKNEDQSFFIKTLGEGEEPGLHVEVKDKKAAKSKQKKSIGSSGNIASMQQQNGANAAVMNVEVVEDSLHLKTLSIDAVNASIQDLIKAAAKEMELNYFIYTDIKGTTTTKVDRVSFDEFLTYILQGTDYTYKTEVGIYLIGDRKLEGLRATKVYQFQYRSLDAVNEIIPADIKKGVEIKEFKELNSILLTGSLPQINEIINFIKPLDKLIPMVTIEVILLDVRKGHSVKTGIRAGLSDSTKTGGTFLPGLDMTLSSSSINYFLQKFNIGGKQVFNIGRVTPNFYVGLSALESNENVEVRNMPKLSTLNGHEANLSIGRTVYYEVKTQNVMGTLNPQTVVTQQYPSVEANLAINIKPVVSGDDQVTLTIDVNISDFIGEAKQGPPPTSKSQFKSIIRVRNEEMLVLGGIERYEKTRSGSGVPILSRIPILKWIFGSRVSTKNKTVSIVFIKPSIIYQ